jgi:hypothetical protein
MAKLMFVGADPEGARVVGSVETQRQVDSLRAIRCDLIAEGQPITWDDVDVPAEPRSLFQMILADRRVRVDAGRLMADRPPFAVATVHEGACVRLEFYEGHDELECTYDLRSPALAGKDLPRWMESDPQAYDPVAYLEEALGLPPEVTRPAIEAAHPESPSPAPRTGTP